jgi:hypothetical protein
MGLQPLFQAMTARPPKRYLPTAWNSQAVFLCQKRSASNGSFMMQTRNIYRLVSLLVVITLVISTNLVAHAAAPTVSAQATTNLTNLAWFYKPPTDGNLALIAQNFSSVILTKNDESVRDQLLSMGIKSPVLEYLRFEAILDPGSCTAAPWNNNVAYKVGDFCDISTNHPDWFLLNTSGQRITRMTGSAKFVLMDPGNAGWRAFFLDRVKQIFTADPVWGGVFLDNVEVSIDAYVRDNQIPANYPDNASFEAAVQGFLEYLRNNFFQPNGKLLSANLVEISNEADFANYLSFLDSAMNESWSTDWHGWRSAVDWEKQMSAAEQTQAMGKFIILVSQGTQTDLAMQNFAYASYLLIANGNASFRYTNCSTYDQAWLYDNYKIDLGAPLGSRYQSGSAWKRDFANGSVTVDPNSHTASISLSTSQTPTSLPPTVTPLATQPPTATSVPPTVTATATKTATPVVTNTPTATATPGQSISMVFVPVADTYVNAGSPQSIYGKAVTLRVDASPNVHAYLRFNVSGLGGKTISRARLMLYANTKAPKGIRAFAVADNTWSESTTNYNNAPAMGGQLALSPAAAASTWTTLDITPYITGEGSFNLGIFTDSATATSLASRQAGANAPQLILDLR